MFLGFLADTTFLEYLLGSRIGAVLYNVAHSTLLTLGLIAAGWLSGQPLFALAGLVMLGHIAFDRAAGYGLNFPDALKHTYLSS